MAVDDDSHRRVSRRTLLLTTATGGVAGLLAGCGFPGGEGGEDGGDGGEEGGEEGEGGDALGNLAGPPRRTG